MIPLNVRLKRPSPALVNADNLHRVAISNLQDQEHALRRWWSKKYKTPPKPLDEYTLEEVYIEHLEDFYERDPRAAKSFAGSTRKEENWDGELGMEAERQLQTRWAKINKKRGVDPDKLLAKYQVQADREMTSEDFKKVMDQLGKNLPGSKVVRHFDDPAKIEPKTMTVPTLGEDFEDEYGG